MLNAAEKGASIRPTNAVTGPFLSILFGEEDGDDSPMRASDAHGY
jgi:hypothetical protein